MQRGPVARLKDNCCVEIAEKERIISETQQGLMEEATSEDKADGRSYGPKTLRQPVETSHLANN